MSNIVSKQLADAIDVPLDASMNIVCDLIHQHHIKSDRNCIDKQIRERRFATKPAGWHDCEPLKMCASCACHWHLSCARNYALGVVR